jgi:hypothetical protein
MAAGLGFKTFTTGEVLTAADTNGYLMQGVLVFADAAARDAAITAPAEGQFAYLKDTDTTTYYTSSAWANLDTTGMVNPMTTTADIIYSSSGSTPARLGIGSNADVLTVAGGVPTWAAPSGGGGGSYTPALTAASTITISSISGIEKLMIVVSEASSVNGGSIIRVIINGDTTNYQYVVGGVEISQASSYQINSMEAVTTSGSGANIPLGRIPDDDAGKVNGVVQIDACASTGYKSWTSRGAGSYGSSANGRTYTLGGIYLASAAVTSVAVVSSSGNFDAGTIYVYGSAV